MYSSAHPLHPRPTPAPCTLAHRVNKGNSKNVISEEEQFFLQQASLVVLLGTLRKRSGRDALALSPAADSSPHSPPLRATLLPPMRPKASSPTITSVSVPPFGTKVSCLCSRVPLA